MAGCKLHLNTEKVPVWPRLICILTTSSSVASLVWLRFFHLAISSASLSEFAVFFGFGKSVDCFWQFLLLLFCFGTCFFYLCSISLLLCSLSHLAPLCLFLFAASLRLTVKNRLSQIFNDLRYSFSISHPKLSIN